MGNLHNLLNNINDILKKECIKKEESLHRGEQFNIFEICGVDHFEVMHSKIISSFLNPKASHGQKEKFLRIFLDLLEDATAIDILSANVYTEYVIDNGRIDILIEDRNNHGIIIENKIYASDGNEQLKRYDTFAKNKYSKGKYTIYYLTLDGHEASEDSTRNVEYKIISYRNYILSWLELCIKESATTPLIRETLVQYYNHLKQLMNLDMEAINKDELLKSMAKNAEAVAAICNAQNEYKQYVYHTYVKPRFESFAKEHSLLYKEHNIFESGNKGFYFHKEEWKSAAIWIYTERKNDTWNFFWGISDYSEKKLKLKKEKLDCFNYSPVEKWPYGWGYLEKYRNWDMNTIADMVNGKYMEYIEELILEALREIEEKGLPLP